MQALHAPRAVRLALTLALVSPWPALALGPVGPPPEAPASEVVLRAAPHRAPEGYARSLDALGGATAAFERDPANRYTYCLRSVATYECLSYGRDGQVRRSRETVTAHGTGFAYLEKDGHTFLLTNQHVAGWPEVSDADHPVEGVGQGCKLVSRSLSIVDDDSDEYGADDIPLSVVVEDLALDGAVVRADTRLRVMPYRIGRSALLRAGDAVTVQGFPLGAFRAVTAGQVTNPHDHDTYGDWEHDDFIIDAPLSSGNSGSPVLAVSERTGEYELVGLFHAEYTQGHALNAAIGIEQLRDLMFKFQRPARGEALAAPTAAQRAEFAAALERADFVPYLRLGPATVAVRRAGDLLLYQVYSGEFPQGLQGRLLLVDAPDPDGYGRLREVWVAGARGYSDLRPGDFSKDAQGRLEAAAGRLRALSAEALRLRGLVARAGASRQASQDLEQERRAAARRARGDADLVQALLEAADQASSAATPEAPLPLDGVLATLTPSPPPVGPPVSPAQPAPVAAAAPVGPHEPKRGEP